MIYFAQQQREMFLQTLRKNDATRTGKELKEYSKEIKTSEERIERLDKIIESLYEDKVEGKISEERYLKMSDTYETEQAGLKERVKTLKSEIAKAKEDDDKILDFMMLIYKYNSFEELTPENTARVHRKSRCSRKDESRRTLQTNGRNLL